MEIQSAAQYQQAIAASKANMRLHVKSWLWSVLGILDVSVEELAQMAGISTQTLENFLHRDYQSTPSLVTLQRISDVSKVPIARPILNPTGPYVLQTYKPGRPRRKVS